MALLEDFPFQKSPLEFSPSDGNKDDYANELLPEALYTSIEDWNNILEWIKSNSPQSKVCDLGAGEARGTLLASTHFKELSVTSIEANSERFLHTVKYLKEKNLYQNNIKSGNFLNTDLSDFDCFFLYLPVGESLYQLFETFSKREKEFLLIAIESHGDLLPFVEDYFDVAPISKIALSDSRHNEFAHIYRVNEFIENKLQKILNKRQSDIEILVEEFHPTQNTYQFKRSLRDVQYGPKKGHITVANPPRLINLDNIISIQ
ncbi:MAG: hypothetical protein GY909_18865 [Oligoflexia bacterium]|nr:hypothetical protein [Oligoflexia bacterium]